MIIGSTIFFILGFPLLGIFILMFMMLDKLNSLNRTNKLLLAYMVNPECMLKAIKSDIVVSNAMKESKAYK